MPTVDDDVEFAAPERANMQRDDGGVRADGDGRASDSDGASDAEARRRRCPRCWPALVRQRIAATHVVGRHIRDCFAGGLHNGVSSEETCHRCLGTCAFFLFCHAFATACLTACRCLTCFLTAPEFLAPRNPIEKFFAFLAKQLSSLWVTALLALFAQWILFRPLALMPRLGISAVHEFELLRPPPAAAAGPPPHPPHLRFNVTTYLLFKNRHDHYKISYKHLAVSAQYADQKLGPADDELPSFQQQPHGSTAMRLVFAGQLRNASGTVARTLAGDKGRGMLGMVVRIRVTQAYKSWPFKPEYFAIFDCPLSSPFPRVGKPGVSSPASCETIFTA